MGFASAAALVLLTVQLSERADRYSPYYALRVVPATASFGVLTNGSLHQVAFDPRSGGVLPPYFEQARTGYHRPYGFMQGPPKHALVLGAGTGNDVAVLLSRGAESIDAVEIDPLILDFGRRLHPARPYGSPRVKVFTTDARSFLEGSHEKYDLIVFGTLDSMTRLSALSNVHLDNFVYTLESLRAARAHLAPGGGLVMYFSVAGRYIDDRLYGMLTEVFGQAPLVVGGSYSLFNHIYMAGPAFEGSSGSQRREIARTMRGLRGSGVDLPSDDWPFLYLQQRGISGFYVSVIALLAGMATAGVFAASSELRASIARGGGADWEMFLFGLGFLLLETSAVTRMNLSWGATWLTSAVVFGSILLTILLSTLWMQLRPIPYLLSSFCLAASLVVVWLVPVRLLLSANIPTRLFLSVFFIGPPIFFASACFAILFRARAEADLAFGWNLLGAVAGGLLELTSMLLGMKALFLVALLAYLSALLIRLRDESKRTVLYLRGGSALP
jgi:Spermine/spermidine synthase domain